MKKLNILVSEETYLQLMQNGGRRIAGRVWLERGGTQPRFFFEPYSHRQRKKVDQLLLATEHGWLKKSAQRYKLHLSVPDHLGEVRTARIMRRESKHVASFMNDMSQLMSNI